LYERKLIELIEREDLERVLDEIEKVYEELRKKSLVFLQELPRIKDPSKILEGESFLPPKTFSRVLVFSVANGIESLKEKMEENLKRFHPDEIDLEILRGIRSGKEVSSRDKKKYHLYLLKSFRFPPMIFPQFTVELFLRVFQEEPMESFFFDKILKFLSPLDVNLKAKLFLKLLNGIKNTSSIDLDVIKQAIDFQRSILWDEVRSKTLALLCELSFSPRFQGDRFTAAKTLFYAAREIPTFYFRYEAMKEIAVKTAFKLEVKTGINFAEKIYNPVWSSAALFEILKGISSFPEKENLISKMKDPYWKLLAKIELHPEKTETFLREYLSSPAIFPSIKLNTVKILRKNFTGKKLKILQKLIKELNLSLPIELSEEINPSPKKEEENTPINFNRYNFLDLLEPLLLSALNLPQNQNKTLLKNVLKRIIN